jgi:hypothetical protein
MEDKTFATMVAEKTSSIDIIIRCSLKRSCVQKKNK